jgi:hypothetical protein
MPGGVNLQFHRLDTIRWLAARASDSSARIIYSQRVTKRLRVLIDDVELRTIQGLARRANLTTAEWVRRRLREGALASDRLDAASKLAAIDAAYRHEAPTPEIDQMLREIDRSYRTDP